MQNLYGKIESLDLKIRQLVQKMEFLRKENKQLIEENIKIKKDKSQYIYKIDQLNREIEELKLKNIPNKSQNSNERLADVKQELSVYMKEIDACVEMLNN